jgi:pyruvate/2-oxoacid:ferredoxin oxidoreductase alpha subunit
MGEGWAVAVADGKPNVFGRRLLFFEPEGEHAAAAVTAGMSMPGLRATNFSSGQGIVYMHESLYPAVGKRLTYVLNVAARAITKHALNVHAGHDDYHAVDDTGFFQLFAKDVQESADLNLIAHRVAELSLNPGIVAQDGFLTSHVIETMLMPERSWYASTWATCRPGTRPRRQRWCRRARVAFPRCSISTTPPCWAWCRTRIVTRRAWRRSGRSTSTTLPS